MIHRRTISAISHAKQGRPAQAEKLFRRAIVHAPKHLGARINLGELLITTNRGEQARTVLHEAHKLAPSTPPSCNNLTSLVTRR
ncbi:MAG: tetratricopeptide repeat protein [Acidobacteria bacterium]|nr:tetratricopeptide repeat protein [Acidobacteriota bacterium]